MTQVGELVCVCYTIHAWLSICLKRHSLLRCEPNDARKKFNARVVATKISVFLNEIKEIEKDFQRVIVGAVAFRPIDTSPTTFKNDLTQGSPRLEPVACTINILQL